LMTVRRATSGVGTRGPAGDGSIQEWSRWSSGHREGRTARPPRAHRPGTRAHGTRDAATLTGRMEQAQASATVNEEETRTEQLPPETLEALDAATAAIAAAVSLD